MQAPHVRRKAVDPPDVLGLPEVGGYDRRFDPDGPDRRDVPGEVRLPAAVPVRLRVDAFEQRAHRGESLLVVDCEADDVTFRVGDDHATNPACERLRDRNEDLRRACVAGREGHEQFKKDALATADRIRKEGIGAYAQALTTNPTRSRFKLKDPRGFDDFMKYLSEHSDIGAANTVAEYQGKRPSLYDFEAEWRRSSCRC